MSTPPQHKYLLKIALVGDCKVGKSALISRFTESEFLVDYLATIGAEFRAINMNIDGANIKVQIWDTSGQERFRFITKAYYRGVGGAILVYDIADHSSYINVARWLKDLRDNMNPATSLISASLAKLRHRKPGTLRRRKGSTSRRHQRWTVATLRMLLEQF